MTEPLQYDDLTEEERQAVLEACRLMLEALDNDTE